MTKIRLVLQSNWFIRSLVRNFAFSFAFVDRNWFMCFNSKLDFVCAKCKRHTDKPILIGQKIMFTQSNQWETVCSSTGSSVVQCAAARINKCVNMLHLIDIFSFWKLIKWQMVQSFKSYVWSAVKLPCAWLCLPKKLVFSIERRRRQDSTKHKQIAMKRLTIFARWFGCGSSENESQ